MPAVSSQSGFVTASECPICGAVKKCGISRDGRAALCWKVPSDRQTKVGSWHHWLIEREKRHSFPPTKNPSSFSVAVPKSKPKIDRPFLQFKEIAIRHKSALKRWSELRGVTVESLINLGAVPEATSIVFPERWTEKPFNICGTNERHWEAIKQPDGSEQRFKFSGNRGFQFGPAESSIPMVLIVEGGFDVASVIDAGFIAVGRCTRAADLRSLKIWLSDIPAETKIVVICENDDAKPGRKSPFQEVRERADELQEVLGRKILVASPPSDHKDMNDWWVAVTEGKGHTLSEKRRTEFGLQMREHLLRSAQADILASNKIRFETQVRQHEIGSEIERAERTKGGPDMDYDIADSCAYKHVFTRQTSEGTTDIMGTKLACGCWKCCSCRRRLLEPKWNIAICSAFEDSIGVFTKWCSEENVDSIKRDLRAKSCKWIVIRTKTTELEEGEESLGEENRFFAISDQPMRGKCRLYDFLDDEKNLEHFFTIVEQMICCVDYREPRPITNSRNILKSERATIEDWIRKIRKICETKPSIYAGYVAEVDSKNIRSNAYQSRGVIGLEEIDFVTIDTDEKFFAICSVEFPGAGLCRKQAVLESLTLLAQKGLASIKASPNWTAKPSKGWDRTGINKGPSEIRATAISLGVRSTDQDFGAMSSVVDASSVRIEDSKTEKFLQEIKNAK